MPAISMFFGILIYMYKEESGKHNLPHIHAEYGEFEAVFDFDGNKIEGKLPPKKEKQVEVWIDIHKEDLQADWKLLTQHGDYFKIPPLH